MQLYATGAAARGVAFFDPSASDVEAWSAHARQLPGEFDAGGRQATTTVALCYDARMKRTTISIPDHLAQAAEREARRRSTSVSEIAREALAAHLGLAGAPRPLPFANLGRSGARHTARRIDELLAKEWRR